MSYRQSIAKHFLVIKAVRQLRQEIEKAGLDDLTTLVNAGKSIVQTYLAGCSPEERRGYRGDFNTLLQFGITPDMILDELSRQMPELKTIMEGKDNYRQSEVANLYAFAKGE